MSTILQCTHRSTIRKKGTQAVFANRYNGASRMGTIRHVGRKSCTRFPVPGISFPHLSIPPSQETPQSNVLLVHTAPTSPERGSSSGVGKPTRCLKPLNVVQACYPVVSCFKRASDLQQFPGENEQTRQRYISFPGAVFSPIT